MGVTRRNFVAAVGTLTGFGPTCGAVHCKRSSGFKSTVTTLFWVGEPSDADNAFIPNDVSYWDQDWQASYGGVDDPDRRNGYWPADFTPRENPFYVALPYGEFEALRGNELKPDAQDIPWYHRGLSLS